MTASTVLLACSGCFRGAAEPWAYHIATAVMLFPPLVLLGSFFVYMRWLSSARNET